MTAVVHVISGLGIGGAESMLVQLAGALQADGLTQHVVSIGNRGHHAEALEARGVEVSALGLKSAAEGLTGLFRLKKILKRHQPQIIQGWMYHGNLMAALAWRLPRRLPEQRLIWNLRASNMDDARYGRILRWTAAISSWPDVIIANSRAGAAFHVSRGYRPRRMEVIPNGIDVERFAPDKTGRAELRAELQIPEDAVVVVNVARTDPMKDHETFLKAMMRLPMRYGLLVGAGTERLSLPSNVKALGLRRDIPRLYACADIVVSTSAFGEGFSNVLAEGMSSGLMPVATDVGDARSIIGDTGTIVTSRDVEALARAIEMQAGLPAAEREKRGALARGRIVSQFALRNAVQAFAHLYAAV